MAFGPLGEALDSAISDGYLPDVNESNEQLKIYRRRLLLLGYLDKESKSRSVDKALSGAIKTFQEDIGLADTALPNKATYNALDMLVAFEPENANATFILALGLGNRALQRAVSLRLSCLGLKYTKKQALSDRLRKFKAMIWALRLPGTHRSMSDEESLVYLFDLDKISSGISGVGTEIHVIYPNAEAYNKKRFNVWLRKLITNTAAIELWLSGYSISLKDILSGRVKITNALSNFWKEIPKAERPPQKDRVYVTYRFFQKINELQQTGDESFDEKQVNETILKQLKNDKKFRDKVEKGDKSLLGRLVDGAKRLLKSIRNFAKGIISGVASLVKNAVRWILQKGQKYFKAYKVIINAGIVGMKKIAPSQHILVHSDFDKDQTIIVDKNASEDVLSDKIKEHAIKSRLRNIALRGFTQLMKAFLRFGTLFSVGWVKVLWSLTKVGEAYEDIRALASSAALLLQRYNSLKLDW